MKLFRRVMAVLLAAGLFAAVVFGEERSDGEVAPSVHFRSAEASCQEDGTYRVQVVLTTDATVHPGEEHAMTVFCADEHQSIPLSPETAGEVHRLEFASAKQPEEVRAVLTGMETAAAVPVNGDRMLILQGGTPGAEYKLLLVAQLWRVLSCPLELSPDPEKVFADPESPGAILTVDSAGNMFLNLTREGLPDGLYLLTGEGKTQYVCLPRVDASGEFLGSVVTVSANP